MASAYCCLWYLSSINKIVSLKKIKNDTISNNKHNLKSNSTSCMLLVRTTLLIDEIYKRRPEVGKRSPIGNRTKDDEKDMQIKKMKTKKQK